MKYKTTQTLMKLTHDHNINLIVGTGDEAYGIIMEPAEFMQFANNASACLCSLWDSTPTTATTVTFFLDPEQEGTDR